MPSYGLAPLDVLFLVLLGLAIAGVLFGEWLWVVITPANDDVHRIKAEYEGITSRAGPNSEVLAVRRAGATMGAIGSRSWRVYEVTLRKFNGETVDRRVSVQASLFGYGAIAEDAEGGSPPPNPP